MNLKAVKNQLSAREIFSGVLLQSALSFSFSRIEPRAFSWISETGSRKDLKVN